MALVNIDEYNAKTDRNRPNMSRLVRALKAAHFEYGAQKRTEGCPRVVCTEKVKK